MKVRELIEKLSKLPEDNEVITAIWDLSKDKATYYDVRFPYNSNERESERGEKCSVISFVDNCPAHTVNLKSISTN